MNLHFFFFDIAPCLIVHNLIPWPLLLSFCTRKLMWLMSCLTDMIIGSSGCLCFQCVRWVNMLAHALIMCVCVWVLHFLIHLISDSLFLLDEEKYNFPLFIFLVSKYGKHAGTNLRHPSVMSSSATLLYLGSRQIVIWKT